MFMPNYKANYQIIYVPLPQVISLIASISPSNFQGEWNIFPTSGNMYTILESYNNHLIHS